MDFLTTATATLPLPQSTTIYRNVGGIVVSTHDLNGRPVSLTIDTVYAADLEDGFPAADADLGDPYLANVAWYLAGCDEAAKPQAATTRTTLCDTVPAGCDDEDGADADYDLDDEL